MLIRNLLRNLLRRLHRHDLQLVSYRETSSHHPTNRESIHEPRVSVLIPTRDKPELLIKCVQSIREKTSYSNIELIIVDNDSVLNETKNLLLSLKKQGVLVIEYAGPFNYSAICNLAAERASGEYLCFLNNDTEIRSPEWLASMVDHASQPDTGLVGSILLYPNGSIQHMGVALGYGFIAGHPRRGGVVETSVPTECFQVTAVTFACAVISKQKFDLLGGLDESLPSGLNDVDFSIRAREFGLQNIVCVHSVLIHQESQTRSKTLSFRGGQRALLDAITFLRKHPNKLQDDFFGR